MKIVSNTELTINGVKIFPGVNNYPFDHKDPVTADQLRIYRDRMKCINFKELLYCDLPSFDKDMGIKPFQDIDNRSKAYKAEKEKKEKAAKEAEERRKEAVKNGVLRRRNSSPGTTGTDGDTDLGGGGISDETEDEGSGGSEIPE
jgi:hypothetical protein